MNLKITVKDTDLGWRKILAATQRRPRATLTVGIVEDRQHPDSDISVAQLGAVHEFGSRDGHTPRRSFLRSTFDDHQRAYDAIYKVLSTRSLLSGDVSIGLRPLGRKGVADVQAKIDSSIPPPLAHATIDAKGHDLALVDSGTLRASIGFRIDKG